jgi:stage II sporulation protein D
MVGPKKLIVPVLLLFSLLSFPRNGNAENINIGILSHYQITRFSFTVKNGHYAVFADNRKLLEIGLNDIMVISLVNGKVEVKSPRVDYGLFEQVNLIGLDASNYFDIKPIFPSRKIRSYDDNLKVSVMKEQLLLINNIYLEHYIAGVVEAEVGDNPAPEFFKLQAILCRTYALRHKDKHQFEGFNLCDRVHCQAYHHRYTVNVINEAAIETEGTVIVDSDINLITAAFYSNCGGQTVNSEDVWQKPLYYLQSVNDNFCRREPNATWRKEIPIAQWNAYLRSKFNLETNANGSFKPIPPFYQPHRKIFYDCYNVHVPLKTIRSDWKLKSTFFELYTEGDNVVLKGKGFGHGSGLCQEGAMRMAASGHSYVDILHFYYKDVHLIDLSQLSFFKEQ